jgi:tetratricopeptide (TPR) repeat protein
MPVTETIAIGQELPTLVKEISQRQIDTYSGVKPRSIHTDEAWARQKGFRTTLAQGMMSTAYVSEMMTRFLGAGFVKGGTMSMIFIKPAYAGDRLTVDVLNGRSLHAYALVLEGDVQKGVAELKALVQQQSELLGANHGDVQRTLGRLANASLSVGDPLTAIDSVQGGLRIERALAGERLTADLGRFHAAMGRALANARRYEEAEKELGRATEILRTTLGPSHGEIRTVSIVTGFVMTRAGRLGQADAVFSRVLAQPSNNPQEEAALKLRLGLLRSAQGQHADAQVLLREAVAFFSKSTPPTNYAVALAALGEAQIEGGLTTDALDTLLQANSFFEKLHPNMSPDRADLLVSLARAQIAGGRAEEAVASADQAATFWRSFDPANRNTAVATLWHARALYAADHAQKASETLRQASAILRTKGSPAERALLEQTQREMSIRRGR